MKLLKTALLTLIASCLSMAAFAQANAIDKYFSQYVNDKGDPLDDFLVYM